MKKDEFLESFVEIGRKYVSDEVLYDMTKDLEHCIDFVGEDASISTVSGDILDHLKLYINRDVEKGLITPINKKGYQMCLIDDKGDKVAIFLSRLTAFIIGYE